MPIRYEKLFRLLKEKGLTKYSLRKDNVVGVATLERCARVWDMWIPAPLKICVPTCTASRGI